MTASSIAIGVCLSGDQGLDLEAFALACGAEADFVRRLVDEGLLAPAVTHPEWRFGGEELTRARRIRRLQRDFEANLQSVGAMLELIDEIDRLRAQLQRAGIALP